MTRDEFDKILEDMLLLIRERVEVKSNEYANNDQLYNLKGQAALLNCSLPEAVLGPMSKHVVSVYSMVDSGNPFDIGLWDEKIVDNMVWLILLKAALIENGKTLIEESKTNA